MRPTVEITPRGGLGNQLFSWAAGLSVAERTGAQLVADPSMITGDSRYEYQLGTFDSRVSKVRQRWTMRGPAVHLPHRYRAFRESSFAYDGRIQHVDAPVRLEGYFQSWRYLEGIEEKITQRCFKMTSPSGWFRDAQAWIDDLPQPPVIVNLRFGDYLTPRVAQGIGLVPAEYFNRGIEWVRDAGHLGRLLAFSDEPHRVSSFLGRDDLILMRAPSDSPRIEQLVLMAQGSAHVIANSTFSWWGATLARQVNGSLTIAPDPWFLDLPHDTKDLLWPEWVTLPRGQ